MLWYIELQFHTRMPYTYKKKTKTVAYDKFTQFPATLKSLSIVTTIHVLTLSCISLGWIESNFAFGPMVSFAIHVTALHGVGWSGVGGVGGRAYQVLRKDAQWGSNSATWVPWQYITIVWSIEIHGYPCCMGSGTVPLSINIIEHMWLQNIVSIYFEPLNFLGHALGLCCGGMIYYCPHHDACHQICQHPARRLWWNAPSHFGLIADPNSASVPQSPDP